MLDNANKHSFKCIPELTKKKISEDLQGLKMFKECNEHWNSRSMNPGTKRVGICRLQKPGLGF